MFPTIEDNMASLWNQFYNAVYAKLDESITDDYYRVLFDKLQNEDLTQGNIINPLHLTE